MMKIHSRRGKKGEDEGKGLEGKPTQMAWKRSYLSYALGRMIDVGVDGILDSITETRFFDWPRPHNGPG